MWDWWKRRISRGREGGEPKGRCLVLVVGFVGSVRADEMGWEVLCVLNVYVKFVVAGNVP